MPETTPARQPDQQGAIPLFEREIEYHWYDGEADKPTLVFLHEGLGSAGLWRDVPGRLADLTGCPALVYSRYGYGGSTPFARPCEPDYMHREARGDLLSLLQAFSIDDPVLIGHSDGGSIALIATGEGIVRPRGLILEAAHVFVEDLTISSIELAREAFDRTDLPQKLARYHADAERTFRGWNEIWLDPRFRDWTIEAVLSGVACPTLIIQGTDDEYGTLAQVDAIAAGVTGPAQRLVAPECRHAPHRDRPDVVFPAIVTFVAGL